MNNSFIFSALNKEETNIVIDAMQIKQVKEGDTVIQQGDEGDYFYVVEEGQLNCSKIFTKGGEDVHLKIY